ncbi:hypothetical protein Taro_013816, partial [Colocasia esculenta]|nr:hypothetical protein [Colocasia esculenta]
VYRFCHGSVDTPTTGVDTGFQTLRQNDEEKCVDTLLGQVDTLRKLFHFMLHLDTWPLGVQGDLPRFLCPHTLRLFMDIWGYKYPCPWHSKVIPRKTRAKSFLEKGRKSGKEASASRGAEQRRQGEKKENKKEKKKEKKRRSSRLQECWSRRRSSRVCIWSECQFLWGICVCVLHRSPNSICLYHFNCIEIDRARGSIL